MVNDYMYYKEKLKGNYKNKFEQIELYCTLLLDNVDSQTREDMLSDVLDTFLSAQNDKLSIEKIIGDDTEKFCEDVCSDLPIKYRIKYIFDLFKYWAWILLIFELPVFIIGIKDRNILGQKTEIGSFTISILIGFIVNIIYKIVAKKKIKQDIKNNKVSKLSKIILPIITYVLIIFLIVVAAVHIEFKMPTWIVLIISVIIIVMNKISYKKVKKVKSNSFTLIVIEEMVKQTKEDYEKINNKNIKKGQKKLTDKEYLEIQITKTEKGMKSCKLDYLIPLVISLIGTIPILLEETIKDAILFFLLVHVITIIICTGITKTSFKYNKIMLKKYKYWKENNISIDNWK